jgi:hypothetical protein
MIILIYVIVVYKLNKKYKKDFEKKKVEISNLSF